MFAESTEPARFFQLTLHKGGAADYTMGAVEHDFRLRIADFPGEDTWRYSLGIIDRGGKNTRAGEGDSMPSI